MNDNIEYHFLYLIHFILNVSIRNWVKFSCLSPNISLESTDRLSPLILLQVNHLRFLLLWHADHPQRAENGLTNSGRNNRAWVSSFEMGTSSTVFPNSRRRSIATRSLTVNWCSDCLPMTSGHDVPSKCLLKWTICLHHLLFCSGSSWAFDEVVYPLPPTPSFP